MAKLYFKYGTMGSSKSAQALITKFNYEERDMKVLLLKPMIDVREGHDVVRSRIGLEAPCVMVGEDEDLYQLYLKHHGEIHVIIVDECQFLTPDQVDQLGLVAMEYDIPVLCFGLSTDFLTHMFPGSCGAKATVNARFDDDGNIVYKGSQILIGGNGRYEAMCRKCWLKKKKEQEARGIL